MDDFMNIQKVYRQLLSTHLSLSSLYATMDFFIDQGTQESLDDIVRDVQSLDNAVSDVKTAILGMIKAIDNDNDTGIQGKQTDDGIRID